MGRFSYALSAAVVLSLSTVATALAGFALPPTNHNVPEPTTLTLLSGGAALVVLGARWFRRK